MKTRTLRACAAIVVLVAMAGLLAWHQRTKVPGERVRVLPIPADRRPEPMASTPPSDSQPELVRHTARALVPSARTTGIAFGEQEDMWSFARQAEGGQDIAFKYEGYQAARECRGLIFAQADFNDAVEKRMRDGDAAPYMALAALNKRCAGFLAAGAEESKRLMQSLRAQIKASNSGLSPLAVERPLNELSDQQKEAALLSGSPTAIHELLNQVPGVNGVAAILAACDLGRACGVDSYIAELLCVISSQCGRAPWADAQDQFDSLKWQAIQREREFLVSAIRSGQVHGLFTRR